jgi:hypothetical protein
MNRADVAEQARETLRQILEEWRAGGHVAPPTYPYLAQELNRQGVTTPTGKPWHQTGLRMAMERWGLERGLYYMPQAPVIDQVSEALTQIGPRYRVPSLRQAARHLNQQGSRTVTGKEWTFQTLFDTLHRHNTSLRELVPAVEEPDWHPTEAEIDAACPHPPPDSEQAYLASFDLGAETGEFDALHLPDLMLGELSGEPPEHYDPADEEDEIRELGDAYHPNAELE